MVVHWDDGSEGCEFQSSYLCFSIAEWAKHIYGQELLSAVATVGIFVG